MGGLALGMLKSATIGVMILALAAGMLPLATPQASAQSVEVYDPYGELPRPTVVEGALEKLGRGLSNVLFGWAEIPVTFDEKLQQGKPLSHLLGAVPVIGTGRAIMRTTTGVFEMVTFPVSDSEVNYEPILEPDYVF